MAFKKGRRNFKDEEDNDGLEELKIEKGGGR